MLVDKSHVIWFHASRNEQYHGGTPSVPAQRALIGIRQAALWVFSTLFEIGDVEVALEERLGAIVGHVDVPHRDPNLDRIIDETYGVIEVVGQRYYTSEILHSFDPYLYQETGLSLSAERAQQKVKCEPVPDEDT